MYGCLVRKDHLRPSVENGGVATAEKATIKATAKPCASGVPVPTKGTVSGTEVITGAGANNCSLILPPLPATVTIAFPWTEKIKWHPSTIHYTQVAYPDATVTSTATAAPVTFGATGRDGWLAPPTSRLRPPNRSTP